MLEGLSEIRELAPALCVNSHSERNLVAVVSHSIIPAILMGLEKKASESLCKVVPLQLFS